MANRKIKTPRLGRRRNRKVEARDPGPRDPAARRRLRLRLAGLAAVLAGAGALVWFLLSASFFEVASVRVLNNHDFSPEEVIGLSGLAPGENIFLAPLAAARERLLSQDNIRDAVIQRVYPETVYVRIFEREARARVKYGRFYTVDADAVVLHGRKVKTWENLPTVYGLEVHDDEVGPEQKRELTALLGAMDTRGLEGRVRVREINMNDPRKITLVTADDTEITLKREEYGLQLDRLLQVLERLEDAVRKKALSIDLRSSRVPVKLLD
ncbi:MAG TPA: cell division protein FtsQ/DivIB [bacterium]|nr:cell division protein FtsQ/DivIB [bacterium]